MTGFHLKAVMGITLLTLLGCDRRDVDFVRTPTIQVTPSSLVFARVTPGASVDREVRVRNVGTGDLLVSDVALDIPAVPGFTVWYRLDEDATPQVAIDTDGIDRLSYPLRVPPQGALFLTVEYASQGVEVFEGAIELQTNEGERRGTTRIPLSLSEGGPEINVGRTTLDFGRVAAQDIATQEITVTNIGIEPLTIDQILLNGSQDFTPLIDGRDPRRQPGVLEDPDNDGEPGLAPGATMTIVVQYAPLTEGSDRAELAIYSNDPNRLEVIVVLTANGAAVCIDADPGALEFRSSLINRADTRPLTIQSCGGAPLVIDAFYLSEDTDQAFALDVDSLPELPAELPAMIDGPPPGLGIRVEFTPREARVYNGTLIIISNATNEPSRRVSLLGRGVQNVCPQAQSAQDEYTVVPLDVVTLDGSRSIDRDGPNARPVEFEWVIVDSPEGSTSQPYERFFNNQQPANGGEHDDRTTPTAQFFVDLAGTYVLHLRVRDNLGLGSIECDNPAVVVINARPEQALLVQLTWSTPLDPDGTDSLGTDLDLHLLRPTNPGEGWFTAPADCFYENPNPDWGQLDNPADDPSLDIDDTNGSGPESISLDLPENTAVQGAPYLVGVHSYSQVDRQTDFNYGPSIATVRIYIDGELAWDFTENGEPGSREMQGADHFWDVAAIEWPAREITTRNQYFEQRP